MKSHLDRSNVSRASDCSNCDLAFLQHGRNVVCAGHDAARAADVRHQAVVGVLPQVDDLLQHALERRLVGGGRRDLLNAVLELDDLNKKMSTSQQVATAGVSDK